MNRNSPIPLWAVLSLGVVLLGGVYMIEQPTLSPLQANDIVQQSNTVPQVSTSASSDAEPGTLTTVLPVAPNATPQGTKYSKTNDPELYVTATPRILAPNSLDFNNYPALSYYGLTFRVPWKETPVIKQGTASVHLQFGDSKAIVLFPVVAGGEWVATVLRDPQMAGYENLGKEHFASNYALRKYLYSVTPDSTGSVPTVALTSLDGLFMWKTRAGVNEDPVYSNGDPVYNFEANDVRGFQYGDPAVKDSVWLDVFDNHDAFFNLLIGKNVRQGDIDFILGSIRSQ